MRQRSKRVTEMGRIVFLAATSVALLPVLIVLWIVKSVHDVATGQKAVELPLTDSRAAALLTERAEAAYVREKAQKHMLSATNFAPWL